jgi:threonyl-tRNA synthetase
MLHRALFGSLERFAGILIEHYAGHLPFWLSPLQIIVATITSDSDNYADDILNRLRDKGLRVEKDIRNEKIGYKIREHSTAKIPVIMVIGKKEIENKTVSVRRLGNEKTETFKIEEIVNILFKESLTPSDI